MQRIVNYKAFRSKQLVSTRPSTSSSSSLIPRAAAADRGKSGLDVNGARVTSPRAWEVMSTELKKAKTQVLSPEAVLAARKKGAVLLDIRPSSKFNAGHIDGAINIPLYELITGFDPYKLARRVMFAVFGIADGTELNVDFYDQVKAQVPKNKQVICICAIGGTLTKNAASDFGRQSRALIASYELLNMGYKNLGVLEGGMDQWVRDDREYMVLED